MILEGLPTIVPTRGVVINVLKTEVKTGNVPCLRASIFKKLETDNCSPVFVTSYHIFPVIASKILENICRIYLNVEYEFFKCTCYMQ